MRTRVQLLYRLRAVSIMYKPILRALEIEIGRLATDLYYENPWGHRFYERRIINLSDASTKIIFKIIRSHFSKKLMKKLINYLKKEVLDYMVRKNSLRI